MRCDFNVPIKNRQVTDDFRIQRSLETIFYLKQQGAKIIILSHLSKPEDGSAPSADRTKLTLKPVRSTLEKIFKEKVRFSSRLKGYLVKQEINSLKAGQLLLLENLRLNPGEEQNSEEFAQELAALGDFYINEAFSVCHRRHASVALLPKFLPAAAGFDLLKEYAFLSQIRDHPPHPFTVIIGGAKLESKMKVIDKFLKTADHILLGGDIADVILVVKGICPGRPWPSQDIVKKVNRINLTDPKIHLPIDAVISPDRDGNEYIRYAAPGTLRKEEEILDIGEETIKKFSEIIKASKAIFWSGPLGYIEDKDFEKGTVAVAKAVAANKEAIKVLGGGDTVDILNNYGLTSGFSFISTGGGAMLSFLSGDQLPGIEALL